MPQQVRGGAQQLAIRRAQCIEDAEMVGAGDRYQRPGGMGFGMFISYQVEALVRQKKLKVVLEAFEPPPRPISVVYPHARLLPARTRLFVDWIKAELETLGHAHKAMGPVR
jgi:DNA-binding transcriptional LysR family regulator